MNAALFVLRLKERELGAAVLFERLTETGDVAVAEDAEHAVKEPILDVIAPDALRAQVANDGGGERGAFGLHAKSFGDHVRAAPSKIHLWSSLNVKPVYAALSWCRTIHTYHMA